MRDRVEGETMLIIMILIFVVVCLLSGCGYYPDKSDIRDEVQLRIVDHCESCDDLRNEYSRKISSTKGDLTRLENRLDGYAEQGFI